MTLPEQDRAELLACTPDPWTPTPDHDTTPPWNGPVPEDPWTTAARTNPTALAWTGR